jgi:hypothetical protein
LGPLAETEEAIRKRVIYLESSPADTVMVTDIPAQRSKAENEETKEGKP